MGKLPCKIVLTSPLARQLFGRDTFDDLESYKIATEIVDRDRIGVPIRLVLSDGSSSVERYSFYSVATLSTDAGVYSASEIKSLEFLTDDIGTDEEITGGEVSPNVSFVKFEINSTSTFDSDKGARTFKESNINRGTRKLLEMVHQNPSGYKLVMVQDGPQFIGDVNERTGQVLILVPQAAEITNLESVLTQAVKLPGDPGIYPFSFEGTLGEDYELSSFKLREEGMHHAVRLEKGFTDEIYSGIHKNLQDFRTKVKNGAIFTAQIEQVSEGHFLKDGGNITEFENKYGVDNVDIKISQEDGKFPKGSLWTTINGIDLPINRNKLSESDINVIDEYIRMGTNKEYVELLLGKAKRNGMYFDTRNGIGVLMFRSTDGTITEITYETPLDDLYTYLVSTYYSFNKEAFAGNNRIVLPGGQIVSYRSFIKDNLSLGIGFFNEVQPDGTSVMVTQPSNRYMVFEVSPKETQVFEEEFAKVEEILVTQDIEETVSPGELIPVAELSTDDIVDGVARLFGIENTLPDVTETLGKTTQFISDASGKRIIYRKDANRYELYEERLHAIMSDKLLNDQSALIEGMSLRERAVDSWTMEKATGDFNKKYTTRQVEQIEYSLGLHASMVDKSDTIKVVEFLHRGISDPSTIQFLSGIKSDNLIDRIVKFLEKILTELGLTPSLFVEVLELNHKIFKGESKPKSKKRGEVDFFTLNTLSSLDKKEIIGLYDWAASKLLMSDGGRVLRLVTTSFNAEKFIAGLHKTLNDSGFGTYVSVDNVKLWADESQVFRFNRGKDAEFDNIQEEAQEGMEGGFLVEEAKTKDKFGERKMSVKVSDYASNAIKTFLGLTIEKSEGLPRLSDFATLYARILSKSEGIKGQSPEQFLMGLSKSNVFQAPQILKALHLKGFDLEKDLKDFTLSDFELSPDADKYNRDLYIQLYQAFHKPETPVEIQREEVEKETYMDEYENIRTQIKRVYYVTHRNTGSNVDRIKESFQKKFQESSWVTKSMTSGDMVATPQLVSLLDAKIKQLLAQHQSNPTSEVPKNKIVGEIFELLGVTFHPDTIRNANFYGALTGPIIASEKGPVGKFSINSFWEHIRILSESNEGLNDPMRQLTRRNQSVGRVKLAGFAKYINQAFAIESKNNETLPAMMAINAAGEKESGFILPNTFSVITNGINSIGKKEYTELEETTLEAAKVNPEAMVRYKKKRKYGNLFTPFAKVSETLSRVREGQKVEWINYSGMEGQSGGDKTGNLTPAQWMLMNIVSMTDTGTMEIMRTQSSSSAFAWKLKDSNANLVTSHAQFRETMWKYYTAERSIVNDGNWKFFQDSGSLFFMEGNSPLNVDRAGFDKWLNNFILEEKANLAGLLNVYNISPSNIAQSVTKPFELSVAEKLLEQVEQDRIISERIVNSFVMNQIIYHMETSILFYGNLGWFKDPHKRFNALTSGGTSPIESVSVDISINEEFSLGHAIGKPFKAGDTFGVVIAQEDEFTPTNQIHNQLNVEQFEDVLLGELDRFEAINGTLTELERDSFINQKRIELRPAFDKAYSKLTVGDGQSHITLDFWRASLIKVGNWSEKAQEFYEYQVSYYLKKRGLPLSAERQEKFDNYKGGFTSTSLKFMYFGPVMEYEEQNPTSFLKTSFNVLIPSVLDGNDLWDTMETMLKNEINVMVFPSVQKSGIQRKDTSVETPLKVARMVDGSLKYNGEMSQHFNAYFKEQIHTNNKLKKNSNRGSQWLKLITSNIKQNGRFISGEIENRYNKWLEVVDKLTDIATREVYEELGIVETPDGVTVDKKKLIDRLLKEEDNDETVIDFLNQNKEFMERTGSTELEIPFEMSMLKQEIGNLIQGIVNKNIVRQKVYGEPLVQVASSGYTNESTRGTQLQRFTKPTGEQVERYTRNGLRWYKRQTGRTETAQCKIALVNEWVNLLQHPLVIEQVELGMDALHALNQLIREGKMPLELIEFAAYRIPTQGLNSMDVFEIAEFLPPSAGNIIIMPAETVAKSGSDYDIDKMYTVMPHISKDGRFVSKYNENSEAPFNEKSKLQNEMLELAKEFTLDPLNYSPLVQPDGTDIIEDDVLDIFKKVFPTAQEDYKGMKAVSFKGNFLVRMAYLTGKKLLGIPAVANTIFQLYNTGGLVLSPRLKDGVPVQPLLDAPRLNFDNGLNEDGKSISRIISSHISAFVDIAKDVKFGYAGMNMDNLGMVMYQLMLGVPYRKVLTLINQPIIHKVQSHMREKAPDGSYKSYWAARNQALIGLVKRLGYPADNDYALPAIVYRNIAKIAPENRDVVDNLLFDLIEKENKGDKVVFRFNINNASVLKLNTEVLYNNIKTQEEMLQEVSISKNRDFLLGQLESLIVYDQLQAEARFMFNGQQTVNHDTSLSIDPISATKKMEAMVQVEADGFISKESLAHARNNVVVRSLDKSKLLVDLFVDVLPVNYSPELIARGMQLAEKFLKKANRRKREIYYKTFANDFLEYAIKTNVKVNGLSFNEYVSSILPGIRQRIKLENTKVPNVLLTDLRYEKDFLRLRVDKENTGVYYEAFLNLQQSSPQLAKDIAILTIGRYGYNKQFNSFSEIIPPSIIKEIVSNFGDNTNLDEFVDLFEVIHGPYFLENKAMFRGYKEYGGRLEAFAPETSMERLVEPVNYYEDNYSEDPGEYMEEYDYEVVGPNDEILETPISTIPGKEIPTKISEEMTAKPIGGLNPGQDLAKTKALTILKAPISQDIMDDMFLISGAGGTGKTYTVGSILDEVRGNIWYAAPTWNATNELKANLPKVKDKVVTLASMLGTTLSEPKENGEQDFILYSDREIASRRDRGLLPAIFKVDVLVIDETSMIGGDGKAPVAQTRREYNPMTMETEEIVEYVTTDSWEAIKFRLAQREAMGMGRPSKILFMGDYAQIPPVGTTRDRDAFIIEYLMGREAQHAVLTQNMRTGKDDLLALHELYRRNIDVANAEMAAGKSSNESIPVTPNPLMERRNSPSVKYDNDLETFTDKFVAQFKLDPTNVKNTVMVNYNKYSRPETQNIISKIRAKLFGDNLNEIEKGELLILGKDLEVKVKDKEYSFKNDTRFIVTNVMEAQKELTGYVSGVYLKGNNLTLTTQVDGADVTFNQFVPLKGEMERVFGSYRKDVKGYVVGDRVIKYGDYKKIVSTYAPAFNYGYVVNSHKVQGSTYNTVFVDEQNILKSPATNKEKNQLVYTAISRPRQEVHIYHPSNPNQVVETVEPQLVGDISTYVNHSGGALGADIEWDRIGRKYGMTTNRHYYTGAKTPHGNVEITAQDKIEGQQKVTVAARQMGRIEPTHQVRDEKLIRNWSQVKYSDAVFAITTMLSTGDEMNYGKKATIRQGKGGTGYAIQMAINANKPVYVYDQTRKEWYKNIDGQWSKSDVPVLTKNFAGIGTREINQDGLRAIESVYKKSQKQNQSQVVETTEKLDICDTPF